MPMAITVIWCVFLAMQSTLVLSNNCTSSSVSLTVEGGGSDLVGPHCPGTVRLVCEGVRLTVLKWSYNGDTNIQFSFSPISTPMVHELSAPFVSVELTNASQFSAMPWFANFSSVLIADFLQLQRDNVANISCGNVAVTYTLQVNITIIEEPVIEDPQIRVNTTQNSSFTLLRVYWEHWKTTQEESCSVYKITHYTITLLWNDTNYTMTVNGMNSCGAQCSVDFNIASLETDENYTVYLRIVNSIREHNFIHRGTIAALIVCPAPQPPSNGSLNLNLATYPLGTTVTYQCDFYPNDVKTTMCSNMTGRGLWVPDPVELECKERNEDDSSATNLVLAIAGGVGAGCLAVGVVVLAVISVKCAYSCRKQAREYPSETDGDMGVYSTLNHRGPKNQPFRDLAADNAELYDRIELRPSKNTKLVQYTDVSTHLGESTVSKEMFPSLCLGVNYMTVDIKATEIRAATMPEIVEEVDKAIELDKMLDLDQSLVQLRAVHSKWREIGAALHIPETYTEQVESHYPNNDTAGMTEVLDYWIRDCCWSHTWGELAEALGRVGEMALAKQLMQAYETGQLPIQLDFVEVPNAMYKHKDGSPPPPLPPRSPPCVQQPADATASQPKPHCQNTS